VLCRNPFSDMIENSSEDNKKKKLVKKDKLKKVGEVEDLSKNSDINASRTPNKVIVRKQKKVSDKFDAQEVLSEKPKTS